MKKLVFLPIILFFIGCSSIKQIPAINQFYGINFSKYLDKGFLITPEPYLDDYDMIAIVNYMSTPELTKMTNSNGFIFWVKNKKITPEQALDSIYNYCISIGADALTNFSLERVPVLHPTTGAVLEHGIEISGYAVRRKPKDIRIQ